MCYSEHMTENMVEQKEAAVAEPEGAANTSEVQANGEDTKRSYEVMAIIPIELFVPGNRKKVREAINNSEEKNKNEFVRVFPPVDIKNPHSRIGDHIKDFSAYEYEIYEIHNNNPWSKAVCEIVNDEIKNCKPGEDKSFAEKIKKKLKDDNDKEQYLDTKIIFALPFASKEKEVNKMAEDTADINENTGVVISIQINVPHVKNESNAEMAKFLKLIGDGLNRAINECPEKNAGKLKADEKIDGIFKLMVNLLPADLFKDDGKGKNVAKNPLHNKIEINYVFTYFVCNGFDFHILTDTYNVDDNIKYSGDAWFLNKGKIYKKLKKGDNKDEIVKYISENYYLECLEKIVEESQSDYEELPEDKKHHWLTEILIPEATIRPKDIYYIPKINGGNRHDYSSVLLKFRNRLCCFIKKEYLNKSEADDKNRIVGMQIVLNSFWHRLIEFSRVMQTLCLASETKEGKNEKKKSKNIDTNLSKMSDMKPETRSAFLDQIYTTPTLPEQILDINSTDQDVLTLHDLTVSSKIDSAANIFSEVKKNFLSLNTDNMNMTRTKEAKKAEGRIQGMFLVLALIASVIGLIELWAEWDISLGVEIFGTVLLFIFAISYLSWWFWQKRRKIE